MANRAIERPHVDPTRDQINALRQTRAVTEALFLDVSNSGVDRGEPLDLSAVNEILAKGTPVASPDLSIAYLASPPWQLPISIIVEAFELARFRPERLRQCQHENCIVWFCDISKGGAPPLVFYGTVRKSEKGRTKLRQKGPANIPGNYHAGASLKGPRTENV